jgi:hypothetical protein
MQIGIRNRLVYFILIVSISTNMVTSQIHSIEKSSGLEKLYKRLVNNYDDTDRIRINDSIKYIIDEYVKSDKVFLHSFTNLRYLGQVTSPDSLLKIITWNLVLLNNPSRYFCYFIRKQETGKENIIYRLTTTYNENSISTDTTYTDIDWYGALYYDVRPYMINDKKFWVLLGIDYGNPYISKKIIDVLSFSQKDSIEFGRKWFVSEDKTKFRDVFEYASNAVMSLRFSSDSLIVFDHLVPFSPSHVDDHQYYGPDYSSDGYNLKDGFWRLKINIDARNKE